MGQLVFLKTSTLEIPMSFDSTKGVLESTLQSSEDRVRHIRKYELCLFCLELH
ncbi:hypothetical protein BT69DRAFT_1279398 [Atractiella rhizophila]|nr:hypothetical protein BT69DRAFT_1279398 [Atractiella rhizophila]